MLATAAKLVSENVATKNVAQTVSRQSFTEDGTIGSHSSPGWFCTIGVSLRGLLSQERLDPSAWVCGVCKFPNTTEDNPEVCMGCKKPRLLEWMHTSDGFVIQPGEVIEPREPVSDSENEDAKFEYGIVTDIVRLPPQIKLCAFRETVDGRRVPTATVLDLEQLRRVNVLPRDDPRIDDFLHFGLCDSCGNTYRIIDGDLAVHNTKLIDLQDELDQSQENFLALKAEKTGHMRAHNSNQVLICSSQLKDITKNIRELRRKLSQKQLWCSFCTWKPQE